MSPGLDITADSVAGVRTAEDGSQHLVMALKGLQVDRKTGKTRMGLFTVEVPITVGAKPTLEEVKAAGKPLWGLVRLGPGVWKLWGGPARLTQREAAYITLVDCPDPAPWEQTRLTVVPA
jgi:hypothetical protein